MKHWLRNGLLVVLLLVAQSVSGQSLFPRLGEQRVGTSALTFLKIGLGARAVGMAGAFVPVANDASSLFWNPAGLVQIGHHEAVLTHIQWPVDIRYEYAGYVHQVTPTFALGFGTGILYTPDMEVTDEFHPNGTGEYFSYSDFVAVLAASIKMTDHFSFGVTAKFAQENMADLQMRGVMLDFGTYYWTGFRSLRFAASMRNFGPTMKPAGTFLKRTRSGDLIEQGYTEFPPPTSFSLGAAMEVIEGQEHQLTMSLQMNHPIDNAENAVLGLEYAFHHNFRLRGGHRFDYGENRWTFGAGAVLPVGRAALKLDYAYADFGRLDVSQQFTLIFQF